MSQCDARQDHKRHRDPRQRNTEHRELSQCEKGEVSAQRFKNARRLAKIPHFTIVEMKLEFDIAKGFTLFSDPLLTAIKARVEIGEQVILFLNRRGYHTTQCV